MKNRKSDRSSALEEMLRLSRPGGQYDGWGLGSKDQLSPGDRTAAKEARREVTRLSAALESASKALNSSKLDEAFEALAKVESSASRAKSFLRD